MNTRPLQKNPPVDEIDTRTKQALLAADNRARANELLTKMLSGLRSDPPTISTGVNIYLEGSN